MIILNRIILIGFNILLMNNVIAQDVETGIAFEGNSNGETYKIKAYGLPGNIFSENPLMRYYGLGKGDSITMQKRVKEIQLFVKAANSSKYKRVRLSIPKGLNRVLTLKRDQTLKRRRYFVAEWTDKMPNERTTHYDELFGRDSANHEWKVPLVEIKFDGRPFLAESIRQSHYLPNKSVVVSILLHTPPMVADLTIDFEAAEILFGHNEAAIRRTRTALTTGNLSWPGEFRTEDGFLIVVNIAYTYRRHGEIIESGVISRNVKF